MNPLHRSGAALLVASGVALLGCAAVVSEGDGYRILEKKQPAEGVNGIYRCGRCGALLKRSTCSCGAIYYIAATETISWAEITTADRARIIRLLDEKEDHRVREAAAKKLQEMGDPAAAGALVEALVASTGRRYMSVSLACQDAVVSLGRPSLDPLLKAWRDPWNHRGIREHVAPVLEQALDRIEPGWREKEKSP